MGDSIKKTVLTLQSFAFATVVYFAFRKPSREKNVNKGHQISRGRRSLMELKNLNRKIENIEIRTLNEEISAMTEKILEEVKNRTWMQQKILICPDEEFWLRREML